MLLFLLLLQNQLYAFSRQRYVSDIPYFNTLKIGRRTSYFGTVQDYLLSFTTFYQLPVVNQDNPVITLLK